MASTAAKEEFQGILDRAKAEGRATSHPDDIRDYNHDKENHEQDEDQEFLQKGIHNNMKMPLGDRFGGLATNFLSTTGNFGSDSRTGVKGVIADARAFEEAKRSGGAWGRAKEARDTVMSNVDKRRGAFVAQEDGDGSGSDGDDFFARWRQQRRLELEREGTSIRTLRTSPSMRRYGKFDEVDADGYLDAIEKVTRETIVVVFIYDNDCPVSQVISEALMPLVFKYPTTHFVGVHYEEIEFGYAGVPAILAYKNCGELFANLTYIIDQIPENTDFDTKALETILVKNDVV